MSETNQLPELSSGLAGLDKTLQGILPGDSIVWQVNKVEDYALFVEPFGRRMADVGAKIIYFRFAAHTPLLTANDRIKVVNLD